MRFDADINARSLPGGGVWRSAAPDDLPPEGWAEIESAGIRRIVDLRNGSERGDAPHRPLSIEVIAAPLEDPDDPDYTTLWDRNWAIADFYLWGIDQWPHLWSAALTAIAHAPEGGILIHCAGGRDRTGMLSGLLLDDAGIPRAEVLADYRTGMLGTNEMLRRQGREDHEAAIPADRMDDILERYGSALDAFLDAAPALLARNDLESVLHRASRRLLSEPRAESHLP